MAYNSVYRISKEDQNVKLIASFCLKTLEVRMIS